MTEKSGQGVGRPNTGQLRGESDHAKVILCLAPHTETAATLLDSERGWYNILEEFLIVSEPLSYALKAQIPRREHVWSWLCGDGKGMIIFH